MVSLRGLTLTAARPRIIVPLFARDPAALCPLAKAAGADPAAAAKQAAAGTPFSKGEIYKELIK